MSEIRNTKSDSVVSEEIEQKMRDTQNHMAKLINQRDLIDNETKVKRHELEKVSKLVDDANTELTRINDLIKSRELELNSRESSIKNKESALDVYANALKEKEEKIKKYINIFENMKDVIVKE